MSIVARKARDEYADDFVQLDCLFLDTDDCFVQQHQAAECDINNIMARYERDGILPHVSQYQGQYGDFTGVVDYRTALHLVQDAEDCFMSLPAHIRKKFDNDPGQFLDFVSDSANADAMIEMGLVKPHQDAKPSSDGAEEGA